MSNDTPVRATITSQFDLGFLLRHTDGRPGQLRIVEMRPETAKLAAAEDAQAGVGLELAVYVLHVTERGYLFSEFSPREREERERLEARRKKVAEEAQVGLELSATILCKVPWGCICSSAEPPLEGLLPSRESFDRLHHPEPDHCISDQDWSALCEGASIRVAIIRKEARDGEYRIYFRYIAD